MGLGGLLLNGALAPNCHSTRVKNSEPAASRPAKPLAVGADVAANFDNPGFVILVPALGFPALVGSDGIFSVLLLSKKDRIGANIYKNALRWQTFDSAAKGLRGLNGSSDEPKSFPGVVAEGYMNELSLADYRSRIERGGFATFDRIHGRLSPGLLNSYESMGYTTLVVLRLQLGEENRKIAGLYTLRCKGDEEVIEEILKKLPEPYEGCPIDETNANATKTFARPTWLQKDKWDEQRGGADVIMLHPVQVGITDGFLNLAHITDLHIARRWDHMQEWVFDPTGHPSKDKLFLYKKELNNPNRNYEAIMKQVAELTKENQITLDYIATLEADLNLGEAKEDLTVKKITKLQMEADASQSEIARLEDELQKILKKNIETLIEIDKLKLKLGPQIMIHTGDLIEYCRGYNGTGLGTYDDNTFEYSTNWTLYYQLLAGNYHLPTFTVLGNHDWRINPYAPSPTPGTSVGFLLLLIFLFGGLGPGLVLWGLQEAMGKPTENVDRIFRAFFVSITTIITLYFSLIGILALVHLETTQVGPKIPLVLNLFFIIGGAVIGVIASLFSFFVLPDNANQIFSGLIPGGILGTFALLFFIANDIWKFLPIRYLKDMIDLEEGQVKQFFPKNFRELDLFGDNGLFVITDKSFLWYSLVINPFMDYAFDFGPTHQFAFLDWNESEGLEIPPIAIDAISKEQLGLLTSWAGRAKVNAQNKSALVRPVLSSHFPFFSQDLDKKLEDLKEGIDVHDNALEKGILEDRRDEILNLLEKLGKENASAIALSGHTHAFGVFQKTGGNVQMVPNKFLPNGEAEVRLEKLEQNKPAFVITICSGPPGDGGEETVKRKSGYRRIYFDRNGQIREMTESDAP